MPQMNRRQQKRRGPNWNWQRGAVGAASGALTGFQAGGPWGAAAGAGAGLVTGGLTGVDTDVNRAGYDAALREFEIDTRRSARVTGDELSAQTGASLAARGINNSEMAAGVVSANRGRLMSAAEQQIGKYRGDLNKAIADAENQMKQADDAMTRQWWVDLAGQLTYWGLSRATAKSAEQTRIDAEEDEWERHFRQQELEGSDAVRIEHEKTPEFKKAFPDMAFHNELTKPSSEVTGAHPRMEDTELPVTPSTSKPFDPFAPEPDWRETPGTAKGKGQEMYPDRDRSEGGQGKPYPRRPDAEGEGPSTKRDMEEALSPEEVAVLEELFPDLDDILGVGLPTDKEIGSEKGNFPKLPDILQGDPVPSPPRNRGGSDYYPEEYYPDKDLSYRSDGSDYYPEEYYPDKDLSYRSDGSDYYPEEYYPDKGGSGNEIGPTSPRQYLINSEYVDEPKMRGLPGYMAYTYHDEGGYNPHDPSYAGVLQDTYDKWTGKPQDAPSDVKDLARRPDVVNAFYHWYLDTQTFIPPLFTRNDGLAYMYNDFAIHAGGGKAKMVYDKMIIKLRGQGITMATDLDLMMTYDAAKRDYCRLQGKNANAFADRAARVRQRAQALLQ